MLERIHEWLDTQEKTGAHRGFCIVAELEDRTSFKVIDIQDIAQYRQEKAQSGRKVARDISRIHVLLLSQCPRSIPMLTLGPSCPSFDRTRYERIPRYRSTLSSW